MEQFQEFTALERLVHEPSRLRILSVLMSCADAEFLFVQKLTGLSKGNLSNHVAKLEEAGLVRVTKKFVGKKPHTTLSITGEGQAAVERYWQHLEQIKSGIGDVP